MKSLLFIGGTGFLGQSFFDCLNGGQLKNLKQTKVIVVSRNKKKITSKVDTKFIKCSISNLKKLPVTDYIIYAANSSNYKENIKGIKNFGKLLNYEHKSSKILFTSSGAVYGRVLKKTKSKESDKISLNRINRFNGYKKNYAKSKIFMENKFSEFGKRGFNVSIARLFTFIGKKILINKDFAVTDLLNQAKDLNSKNIILNSKNDVYRGYMNSKDLVMWIVKILVNSNKNCDVFNVGSDEVISIKKLAQLISKKYKKKINYSVSKNNNEKFDFYVPSILKAKKVLKLKLKFSLKQSLRTLYKV